jgi:hypothetical protein
VGANECPQPARRLKKAERDDHFDCDQLRRKGAAGPV